MTNYRYCPLCKGPLSKGVHPICKNCGFTLYRNPAPTVGVFIVKDDQVLLSRRAIEPFKNYLDTIGGFLEAGETLEAGAKREVKEETGLEIELLELLGDYPDTYNDGQRAADPLLAFSYVAKITAAEESMRPMDDISELVWVKIDEIPANDMAFKANQRAAKDLQTWYKNSSKA